jgi:enterobactin synthetase component D
LLAHISLAAPFDPPCPSSLSFCRCNFDWRQNCEASFERYGVQCPAQAANWSTRRRAEYLAGRYCAIKALSALPHSNGASGAMQLPIRDDCSPQWPPGTVGSISHSQHQAIAITARDSDFSGLGIDCETLLTDSAAAEIAPWVLQPNDLNCKIEVPLSYGFLITLIFSAKESLFKALAPRHKNILDFGHLSDTFFVSKVTAKTLILHTDMTLNQELQSNTQFQLSYTVDQQQIITMALLTRN